MIPLQIPPTILIVCILEIARYQIVIFNEIRGILYA